MKEFGHKSSSSRPPPPPKKKKKSSSRGRGGGPIGEKDKWPNSFIKVVLGKETTFITNFLHIRDYFYEGFLYIKVVVGRETFRDYFYEGFLYIKVVVGRQTFRDYFYEGFLYIKVGSWGERLSGTTFMKDFFT